MNAKTLEDLQAELARQDAEFAELFTNLRDLPPDLELALAQDWMDEFDKNTQPSTPPLASLSFCIRA